jgi:hypothetical protein
MLIDVAAKVLADNLASLLCAAAAHQAELPTQSRRCNPTYAAAPLQRGLPRLVLNIVDFIGTIHDVLQQLLSEGQNGKRRHFSSRRSP